MPGGIRCLTEVESYGLVLSMFVNLCRRDIIAEVGEPVGQRAYWCLNSKVGRGWVVYNHSFQNSSEDWCYGNKVKVGTLFCCRYLRHWRNGGSLPVLLGGRVGSGQIEKASDWLIEYRSSHFEKLCR